jgi:hypothetical protein
MLPSVERLWLSLHFLALVGEVVALRENISSHILSMWEEFEKLRVAAGPEYFEDVEASKWRTIAILRQDGAIKMEEAYESLLRVREIEVA